MCTGPYCYLWVSLLLVLLLFHRPAMPTWSGDPDIINYHTYYYPSIRGKMGESTSASNCTIGGAALGFKYGDPTADLQVRVLKPRADVLKQYMDLSIKNPYVFYEANPMLCSTDRFKDYSKGYFKRAKGCWNYTSFKHLPINKRPVNRYAATLHPDHVRCDNSHLSERCTSEPKRVPQYYREMTAHPFVVTASDVIVSRSGMIALPCGAFGLFASCEAVKCGLPLAREVVNELTPCRKGKCKYPTHDRVFVMTQYDDTQIGQFILEDLPKLIWHLDFLKANSDIRIHYGFNKQSLSIALGGTNLNPDDSVGVVEKSILPHKFFDMLGLRDRLINGTIYANEILIPREGGCQDAGYNIWELVNMKEHFLRKIEEDKNFYDGHLNKHLKAYHGVDAIEGPYKSAKKLIVILQRTSSSEFTRNQDRSRRWSDDLVKRLISSFASAFGQRYRIVVYSDQNFELMKCYLCQVKLFSDASMAVGLHGAGLTNTLYMKPNSVVVEIVSFFDSRHAPLTGIFSRLSGLLGLHHYSYQIVDQTDNEKRAERIDVESLASDVSIFTNKIFLGKLTVDKELEEGNELLSSNKNIKKSDRDKLAEEHLSETLGIDYGG